MQVATVALDEQALEALDHVPVELVEVRGGVSHRTAREGSVKPLANVTHLI
jgi:hypothetical protein